MFYLVEDCVLLGGASGNAVVKRPGLEDSLMLMDTEAPSLTLRTTEFALWGEEGDKGLLEDVTPEVVCCDDPTLELALVVGATPESFFEKRPLHLFFLLPPPKEVRSAASLPTKVTNGTIKGRRVCVGQQEHTFPALE